MCVSSSCLFRVLHLRVHWFYFSLEKNKYPWKKNDIVPLKKTFEGTKIFMNGNFFLKGEILVYIYSQKLLLGNN